MKNLIESWVKYLKEDTIQEATDEEISYIEELLDTPPEELPFENIFGDSYRFLEKIVLVEEDSFFETTFQALQALGWTVMKPDVDNGKFNCSKVKITNYITGGEEQVRRSEVVMSLPKVLDGILRFIESSFNPMNDAYFKTLQDIVDDKERRTNPPEGAIYKVPFIKLPVTQKEFLRIYKFVNTSHFWIGLGPGSESWSERDGPDLGAYIYREKKVDPKKLRQFSNYVGDDIQDLIANMQEYFQNYYLIYSRHPVDVFRMSDHKGLESCHSLPSSQYQAPRHSWDEFNICALSEAHANGMIVYAVPEAEFRAKGIEPNQEFLDEFGNREMFADEQRGIDGIKPTTRIRIRKVLYHGGDQKVMIAVPETGVYGYRIPGIKDVVMSKITSLQQDAIDRIVKGKSELETTDFTRYGGNYQDNPVSELLPKMFRKAGIKIPLIGNSVNYSKDMEDALAAEVGEGVIDIILRRSEEIFDRFSNDRFSWDHQVVQDWNGNYAINYSLTVNFEINVSHLDTSMLDSYKIQKYLVSLFDNDIPELYGLPKPIRTRTNIKDNEAITISVKFSGNEMKVSGENIEVDIGNDLDGFESSIQQLMTAAFPYRTGIRGLFDRFQTGMIPNYAKSYLESTGLLPSEIFKLMNTLEKFSVADKTDWEMEEFASNEDDVTGREYFESVEYRQDLYVFFIDMLKKDPEDVDPDIRAKAAQVIANYLNNSKELLPIKVVYNMDTDSDVEISAQDVLDIMEKEDTIDFSVSVVMSNENNQRQLDLMCKFLSIADQDTLGERIAEDVMWNIKEQLGLSESKRIKIKILRD